MSNHWPATAKQRAFGISLENILQVDRADWLRMSVDEARDRISMLVQLRTARIATLANL